MRYQRIPIKVDAIQVPQATPVGEQFANAGDFIVTYEDGSMSVIAKDVFLRHYEPVNQLATPAVIKQQPEPQPQPPSHETKPGTIGYVCLGCGQEVAEEIYEKKSGLCVNCLKQDVECQTCASQVKQYELIGTYCRRCLPKT